ncbi:hypothetical protein FQ087_05865 [Sporosarcina sp. ANT_H38]|uniref:hypothetical protein n=1 Tax=Sporosarcina sp. ANT_H38 TaxID=2597358 RepID=UPI0011F3C961|nr:hypothetical protein [Sporosarcina sp. ANT_H38]KAA0965799.1 hypothetical protein FQ087_05865 [Sporosarcina sp. ANT_H38]
MSEKSTREEENIHITYYFTVIFIAIGTVLVFFILYQKVGKVDLFIILLSTSAGGIPIGFIGAFIDYKVSAYKFEKRSFEQ